MMPPEKVADGELANNSVLSYQSDKEKKKIHPAALVAVVICIMIGEHALPNFKENTVFAVALATWLFGGLGFKLPNFSIGN